MESRVAGRESSLQSSVRELQSRAECAENHVSVWNRAELVCCVNAVSRIGGL